MLSRIRTDYFYAVSYCIFGKQTYVKTSTAH